MDRNWNSINEQVLIRWSIVMTIHAQCMIKCLGASRFQARIPRRFPRRVRERDKRLFQLRSAVAVLLLTYICTVLDNVHHQVRVPFPSAFPSSYPSPYPSSSFARETREMIWLLTLHISPWEFWRIIPPILRPLNYRQSSLQRCNLHYILSALICSHANMM